MIINTFTKTGETRYIYNIDDRIFKALLNQPALNTNKTLTQNNQDNIITIHPLTPNETVPQSIQNNIDNGNDQQNITNIESENVNEFNGPVNSEHSNVQGQTEHPSTNEETQACIDNITGNDNIELPNIP